MKNIGLQFITGLTKDEIKELLSNRVIQLTQLNETQKRLFEILNLTPCQMLPANQQEK